MTAADEPTDEPTGDEAPSAPGRHRRGFFGWLRSFAVISIAGGVLAVTVLTIGLASLLADPAASRGVLPFRAGPAPTGPDPQPSLASSPSPSPAPSPSRVMASRSPAPSKSVSPSPSPQVLAIVRHEAESATVWRGRLVNDHAGFSGAGFVDFDNVTGSYVQWSVPAPSAGKVTVRLRYANGSGTVRPVDILVNGSLAIDELTFPQTGAWPNWDTRIFSLTLVEGTNTIRVVATTAEGGSNLDYLELVP